MHINILWWKNLWGEGENGHYIKWVPTMPYALIKIHLSICLLNVSETLNYYSSEKWGSKQGLGRTTIEKQIGLSLVNSHKRLAKNIVHLKAKIDISLARCYNNNGKYSVHSTFTVFVSPYTTAVINSGCVTLIDFLPLIKRVTQFLITSFPSNEGKKYLVSYQKTCFTCKTESESERYHTHT